MKRSLSFLQVITLFQCKIALIITIIIPRLASLLFGQQLYRRKLHFPAKEQRHVYLILALQADKEKYSAGNVNCRHMEIDNSFLVKSKVPWTMTIVSSYSFSTGIIQQKIREKSQRNPNISLLCWCREIPALDPLSCCFLHRELLIIQHLLLIWIHRFGLTGWSERPCWLDSMKAQHMQITVG